MIISDNSWLYIFDLNTKNKHAKQVYLMNRTFCEI
jgi:hypothetical protein